MTTRRDLLLRGGLSAATLAGVAAPPPAAHAQSASFVPTGRVETGLETQAADGFRRLAGLKVGLVTNPTGVLPDLTSTIDALAGATGVKLRALFGPEHGVRGDVPAGDAVAGSHDAETGLPVYSLYGRTQVPTAAMLTGLDALVIDLQDIGSRSYTYLSTVGCVLEAASLHRIPVIVLDRPNPLGLACVEGGPIRDGFTSFVGKYPIAYRHAMTLGELARMIVGRGWLPGGRSADLTVVPCRGLTRTMDTWASFGGLPWVPTSPHIPQPTTPHFYALTGIVGELTGLSIGVGYTLPFEMAGAPGVAPKAFAHALARHAERNDAPLAGLRFRPATWTPFYGNFKGKRCDGVQIYLDDPSRPVLTRLNFEILVALRAALPGHALFTGGEAMHLFDRECGTDRVRHAFLKGADGAALWAIFDENRAAFENDRRPYLIYP